MTLDELSYLMAALNGLVVVCLATTTAQRAAGYTLLLGGALLSALDSPLAQSPLQIQ